MAIYTILPDTNVDFKLNLKVLPTKGKMVYEYNPFRNYRLNEDKVFYKGRFRKFTKIVHNVPQGNTTILGYKIILDDGTTFYTKKGESTWYDENLQNPINTGEIPEGHEKGELVDFITSELNFSLNHPVDIIPQYSYDGSVNLIINDGLNAPKLINSRFSATGLNTYEIKDRFGNNDTNIYDEGALFNTDTSLYKSVVKIPKIKFKGCISGGNMKVGNYHFYFKLSDADGNETDFVGESGLVSVFIGSSLPSAITSGLADQNSFKCVHFYLSNIDQSYDYIYVYYSRYSAEGNENSLTFYTKIDRKFTVDNIGCADILITGFDNEIPITASEINLNYNIASAVNTLTVCQNMLFMGNIHKVEIPYKELQDLSLRFLPYLKEVAYETYLDADYNLLRNSLGYYDPLFIYSSVGYWDLEIYRFGVVYILPNGELTPVFNIRGRNGIGIYVDDDLYTDVSVYDNGSRQYVDYDEATSYLNKGKPLENVKGVCRFNAVNDANTIHALQIKADSATIKELKKYVKGFFFVRLTRIPLILALGMVMPIDLEAHVPVVPVGDESIAIRMSTELAVNTHVTADLNKVHYLSEGFLSRYNYKFEARKSVFRKIALISAAVAITAVGIAGAAFTGGASLAAAGIAGSAVMGAITTGALAVTAAAAVASGVAAGVSATVNASRRRSTKTGNAKLTGRLNVMAPKHSKIVESPSSRQLVQEFSERFIVKGSDKAKAQAIYCPDYTVHLEYFNSIFTGNEHTIQAVKGLNPNINGAYGNGYLQNTVYNERHFYMPRLNDLTGMEDMSYEFKVTGVPDDTKLIILDNIKFRSRAGMAEEAFRYECVGDDYKSEKVQMAEKNGETATEDDETVSNKKINSDIIRGSFSPYLAFNDTSDSFFNTLLVNIYISGYSPANMTKYFNIRMLDTSSFHAISDRYDINELGQSPVSIENTTTDPNFEDTLYRGDCYICQFTQRINRNFCDPSAPYNDDIINPNTWHDNYDPADPSKYAEINLGDVNAVLLGMWVTFPIRSSYNLNIRTLDESNIDESIMTGGPRGYFPYSGMSVEGNYKKPDSQVYNSGFAKSVSERYNFAVPDVPYIKDWFGTRVMYSDIHINDAYKNGFRTFLGTAYKDFTREYGQITKIEALGGNLLIVFEHGIGISPVDASAPSKNILQGNEYLNVNNVLGELKVLTDMFGSLWKDSVMKVPGEDGNGSGQWVYGVDTVAKKIWRTNGSTFQILSDMKVLEFLNTNITLSERELTPIIGIRNVKTFYNAFKKDVLFTFYDDTHGVLECVWNLCFNELLQLFVTFYSWVPTFMNNIDNIPFSFDRNTSKWIAKLGISHANNSFADLIVLNNNVMKSNNFTTNIQLLEKYLPNVPNDWSTTVEYSLVHDPFNNYKKFKITNSTLSFKNNNVLLKDFESELYYRNKAGHSYADWDTNQISYLDNTWDDTYKTYPIFKNRMGLRPTLPREQMKNPDKIVTLLRIQATIYVQPPASQTNPSLSEAYYNYLLGEGGSATKICAGTYTTTVALIPKWNMLFLTTDFWKHGLGGIIDIADDIYPCYWYGKQHPFEFEVIVADDIQTHKIFSNLELISNNAEPESFHYEVVGDNYDFANDKANMYWRLEAMKAIWQYNGADISYNPNFLKITPRLNSRSADLIKTYYARLDTINEVEDFYVLKSATSSKDYAHLSGGEIVYYPNRLEYRVWSHAPAVNLDKLSLEDARNLIKGNMQYIEDKWRIQINPIIVVYKNEYIRKTSDGVLCLPDNSTWMSKDNMKYPTLPVYNSPIPTLVYSTLKDESGGILYVPKEIGTIYGVSSPSSTEFTLAEDAVDTTNWLNSLDIYKYDFGEAHNRKETDIRGKFLKIRIRYTGNLLAIIDTLNTLYQVSYA